MCVKVYVGRKLGTFVCMFLDGKSKKYVFEELGISKQTYTLTHWYPIALDDR